MSLEIVIVAIIVFSAAIVIMYRKRAEIKSDLAGILRQILGSVLLVCGLLGLFPAFYLLFHGRNDGTGFGLLGVSVVLTFGGFFLLRGDGHPRK